MHQITYVTYSGHEGWKHGRIIKMDTSSSQVKVLYFNDKDHYNYSYWFHIEDSMEFAPFQSKHVAIKLDANKDEQEDSFDDMYDDIKSDDHRTHGGYASTPQSSVPPLCPQYSNAFSICSDHHIMAYSPSVAYDYNSLHHGHYDPDYKKHESMLHQLSAFGYDADDIQDAIEHVANPSDINQIVDYMLAKDMKKMSESAKSSNANEWKSSISKTTNKSEIREHRPSLAQSATSSNEGLFAEVDEHSECSTPFLCKSSSKSVFGAESLSIKSSFVNEKDYGVPIPNILIKLKDALFANRGHLIENIFGLHPVSTYQHIQQFLNEDKLQKIDLRRMDVVVIANLIKLWFQSLPQRILHDVGVNKLETCENIHDAAHIIKNDIGEPNESLFKWLLDFCVDVVQFEKINKMSVKYMAKVFGPTLLDENKISAISVTKFVQLSILYRHFEKQQ